MDPAAFIQWALDDARTLEERYATLILVERGEDSWHAAHKTGRGRHWETSARLRRERYLNPAYQPVYTRQSLERAAEIFAKWEEVSLSGQGYQERPIRDITVLKFLPHLRKVGIGAEVGDISLLAEMPNLQDLSLTCPLCEDYRPLGRCRQLRKLHVSFLVPWPVVDGLGELQGLEELVLRGNLLALPRACIFPWCGRPHWNAFRWPRGMCARCRRCRRVRC